MSRGGQKPGRGHRTITADEAELWKHATRTLERVKAKPRVPEASHPEMPLQPTPHAPSTPKVRAQAPSAAASKAAVASVRTAGRSKPAPLPEFERRKLRQIGSGKIEIDARIDLHGLRQDEARVRLRTFLLHAYAQGHRTVLVITGKGGEAPADRLGELAGERRRGVLRRSVPSWLEDPDLRAVVVSYAQAGVRHGGAGALYVQLRKSRG